MHSVVAMTPNSLLKSKFIRTQPVNLWKTFFLALNQNFVECLHILYKEQ